MQEVLFTAQIMAARNYQYFTLYTVVGAFYFAVGFPAARLVDWLERRTAPGLPRRRAAAHDRPHRRWSRSIDLHKSYGHSRCIKGVSLSVARGEVVCIIGPSGSGKSTFLRCLNWLEVPERGQHPHRRPAGLPRRWRTASRSPAAARDRRHPRPGRHGVPVLQPVPAHDRARERHRGAAPRAAAAHAPRPASAR